MKRSEFRKLLKKEAYEHGFLTLKIKEPDDTRITVYAKITPKITYNLFTVQRGRDFLRYRIKDVISCNGILIEDNVPDVLQAQAEARENFYRVKTLTEAPIEENNVDSLVDVLRLKDMILRYLPIGPHEQNRIDELFIDAEARLVKSGRKLPRKNS